MPQVLSEFGHLVGVSNVDVQQSEMPDYTQFLLGQIVQYTGATTSSYTNGYFYKRGQSGWEQVNVQPQPAAVLTTANQGLTDQEKANARANTGGAGFIGSHVDC